ncbi:MAG: endonuclease MutS2 [Clostridia bacterium]|nr:endonuclease MutS2 [Clostridia bacterium]
MNEIARKSMEVLELPKVLERLASHASSAGGAALCRRLQPAEDIVDAKRLLDETEAAWKLSVRRGSPAFAGISDCSESLARACLGGVMSLRELLCVAALLRSAAATADYNSEGRDDERTCLDTRFNRLYQNRYFEQKIELSIAGEDHLADGASPELADLRRQIRAQEQKVRDILQHLVVSAGKYLQEGLVTQRGGRFCVPVKSEHKADVPGIVHDTSASGATLFVEPMSVVAANNKVAELEGKARREEERIIAALSAEAAGFADSINEDYRLLTELDAIFARAKYAERIRGERPRLSAGGKTNLIHARHPLLNPDTVVPVDISVGTEEYDTLIVTGPNTGGKTVSLKTLGLLCLMAACGLYIPAREDSEVGFYTAICADIGDEQSIEQSLSTFSSHMRNIIDILQSSLSGSLVLFDELGAGTDPAEGAALAIAIIEAARKAGAKVAATTHYAELKMFALRAEGVINAACEFDVETLRPTYRLLIGVPGKSNAFAIASRLGLPADIIEHAGTHVSSENKYFEEVVEGLIRERHDLQKQREAAEAHNRELAGRNEKMAAEAETARKVRESLRAEAARDAERILADAKQRAAAVLAEIEELRREMQKSGFDAQLMEARSRAKHSIRELEKRPDQKREPVQTDFPKGKPPKVGEVVELVRHGVTGTVTAVAPDGRISVTAGIMKVTVDQSELRLAKGKAAREKASGISISGVVGSAKSRVSTELDLRGMMVDEALMELEDYLDCVSRAGLHQVTVIHGKGTGALREAVRKALQHSRLVKTFRGGVWGEGDTGVTVVEL